MKQARTILLHHGSGPAPAAGETALVAARRARAERHQVAQRSEQAPAQHPGAARRERLVPKGYTAAAARDSLAAHGPLPEADQAGRRKGCTGSTDGTVTAERCHYLFESAKGLRCRACCTHQDWRAAPLPQLWQVRIASCSRWPQPGTTEPAGDAAPPAG